MGRIVFSIGKDRRGGALLSYAIGCLMIVMSSLFATQIAGPYLNARIAGVTQALTQTVRLAVAAPSGGCQGGGCPVRTVASPIGYPGLGALNTGNHPAFLIAASPAGG